MSEERSLVMRAERADKNLLQVAVKALSRRLVRLNLDEGDL
jgi:hypothetical protein